MIFLSKCRQMEALKRNIVSTLQHFNTSTVFLGALFFAVSARAQFASANTEITRSASGQFIIIAARGYSPLLHQPDLATNSAYVRLEPALLAISAEHFKTALWGQLGLKPGSPWSGKIFLALHPARTPDDDVTIKSISYPNKWDFRVELPDVVRRVRYARALAAVLLLEIASRNVPGSKHAIEIPPWLADGLAQQVLARNAAGVALSTPARAVNGIPESRHNKTERGLDPLADVHVTLQKYSALTFDQLSWPDDTQLNGRDGGVYFASAQLFVHELLNLKNGTTRMRAMLSQLPHHLNWQTAFYSVFRNDFKSPLDVDKWWALRVVAFAEHDPGPRWTSTESRARLTGCLSVPVEFRSNSNSLPAHAEISLQEAIRNFSGTQREAVLRIKLRDLELARFRLASPFAGLAADYITVLKDFLGDQRRNPVFPRVNQGVAATAFEHVNVPKTIEKLDTLDARRRAAETNLKCTLSPLNSSHAIP